MTVVFVAVLVFVAMRVTETSSLFGSQGSPGLFDLLRGRNNSDVAQTFQNYDARSERLADGSVHEQVWVMCAFDDLRDSVIFILDNFNHVYCQLN